MFDFTGKVLLLTGANGGIPRAVARMFYHLNASLVLTDIALDGLNAFARELDPDMRRIAVTRHDARNREDADAAVELAVKQFGGIDYVVTGAGLYRDQAVEDMSDEKWRETLDVNLNGVFYVCRAAIPVLRTGAAIVNIASIAGHRGSPQHAHYAASKGAVLSFSRSLAAELAPRVRVNAVSPGFIDTPFIKDFPAARVDAVVESTPLKRLGRPDDIAGAVTFLCSDLASFITGETLHINGGFYIAS
jgi:3-oxoacyl-[acyl-carrier protein] reductase